MSLQKRERVGLSVSGYIYISRDAHYYRVALITREIITIYKTLMATLVVHACRTIIEHLVASLTVKCMYRHRKARR